jgi:hypothetical protein
MSTGFQEFGFGQNDTGIGERAKKFKGEKGKTYRIGFAWWPGMESDDFDISNLMPAEGSDESLLTPKFIGAPRNYHKEAGYFINKGPEYTSLAGENPRMMVATLVVSWPLGRNGQPDKDSLFSGMPDVMPLFPGQVREAQEDARKRLLDARPRRADRLLGHAVPEVRLPPCEAEHLQGDAQVQQ